VSDLGATRPVTRPDGGIVATDRAGSVTAMADDERPTGRRRLLGPVVRMVLALGAVAVLVYIGTRNATDLSHVHLRLQVWWLVAAVPAYAAGSLLLALGWREELAAFGHRLPVRLAIRIWWRAQLARYIPTGLAAFASREVLARDAGVPNMLGAASLMLELVTVVGWGCLLAAVGLPSSLLSGALRVVLGVAAGAGLLVLPVAYPRVAAMGRRVPALDTLARTPGRRAGLYRAVAVYGGSVTAKSVAFVLFATALVTTHHADAWLLGGAVQAAAVIGIIGVTPAGLGVREGAMIGLLGHRFGTTDAAAVAVAWRAWEFAFELAWLTVGTVLRPRERAGIT
jgi:glycosyltransferase 2 family protein